MFSSVTPLLHGVGREGSQGGPGEALAALETAEHHAQGPQGGATAEKQE